MYIEMLREKFSDTRREALTKPTKGGCVSFVSAPRREYENFTDRKNRGEISESALRGTDRTDGSVRPAVFEYQITDKPGAWLTMICPPGTDLAEALDSVRRKFGPERVGDIRVFKRGNQ